MPLYEFRCNSCETEFEKLMSMSAADNGVSCPDCGSSARRLVSAFAAFKKGEGGQVSSVGGGCSSCSSHSCASCGH